MDNVRIPIETIVDGNKITKVCVEDIYKMLNKVIIPLDKARDLCDWEDKEYGDAYGSLVIGRGSSQPCMTDAFDEEIGNNIAFMKAKLNANIKKRRLLERVYNCIVGELLPVLDDELDETEELIKMDLCGIRKHNSDYLSDLEAKLGIQ